jgi:predicted nuclease of predicted toxin-antitoxin system
MRLYLDDDTASTRLTRLLRTAGQDVQIPGDVGLSGSPDPLHLTHSIGDQRVCVTKNHDDFRLLHNLIRQAQGRHPGLFVVRQDNDPSRDLTPKGIVAAIRKLEAAGVPIENEFIILNHWR